MNSLALRIAIARINATSIRVASLLPAAVLDAGSNVHYRGPAGPGKP
ncbi:hypothetical protein [Paenarthrobacter sp. 4246]